MFVADLVDDLEFPASLEGTLEEGDGALGEQSQDTSGVGGSEDGF